MERAGGGACLFGAWPHPSTSTVDHSTCAYSQRRTIPDPALAASPRGLGPAQSRRPSSALLVRWVRVANGTKEGGALFGATLTPAMAVPAGSVCWLAARIRARVSVGVGAGAGVRVAVADAVERL